MGFEAIAEADAVGAPEGARRSPKQAPVESQALEILATRGYQEAITYAFVDPALQGKLFPGVVTPALSNPDLERHGRHARVAVAGAHQGGARESAPPAGSHSPVRARRAFRCWAASRPICSPASPSARASPEQWGAKATPVDFFDVKQDLEALFARTGASDEFGYIADSLPCLHPGRSARITRGGKTIGWIGELHPQLVQEFDFTYAPDLVRSRVPPGSGGKNAAF